MCQQRLAYKMEMAYVVRVANANEQRLDFVPLCDAVSRDLSLDFFIS
jgi:hypothetical protein